jgi:hypothetical protein
MALFSYRFSKVAAGSGLAVLAVAAGCSSSSGGPPAASGDAGTDSPVVSLPDATGDTGEAASEAGSGILVPSNFDPTAVVLTGVGAVDVPGMADSPCDLDTDQGTLTCQNQAAPFPIVVTPITLPGNGGHATLFAMTSFTLDAGKTLTVSGTKPAILYALGAVDIEGMIDVAAHGSTEGAGGYHAAGPGQGADGASVIGDSGDYLETQGAGGGSYCGVGGAGSPSLADGGPGGPPGATYGTAALVPILGGSSGGSQSSTGYGGGAIQITSNVSILVGAAGGINADGDGGDDHFAVGGGGGSGGAILLESPKVTIAGTLTANGGGGGDAMEVGADGNVSITPAPGGGLAGGAGSGGGMVDGQGGATSQTGVFGGGGGGAGRIRINNSDGSTALLTGVFSPALTTACGIVAVAAMQ